MIPKEYEVKQRGRYEERTRTVDRIEVSMMARFVKKLLNLVSTSAGSQPAEVKL